MKIALALAAVVIVVACTDANAADEPTSTDAPTGSDAPVAVLQELNQVDELQALFSEDDGSTRLVLLLSPT